MQEFNFPLKSSGLFSTRPSEYIWCCYGPNLMIAFSHLTAIFLTFINLDLAVGDGKKISQRMNEPVSYFSSIKCHEPNYWTTKNSFTAFFILLKIARKYHWDTILDTLGMFMAQSKAINLAQTLVLFTIKFCFLVLVVRFIS